MIDAVEGYVKLERPGGRNLALITISGGFGVIASDLVSEAGFGLPAFSPETAGAIGKHIHMPGTSSKNPLDLAANIFWLPDHSPLFKPINDDPDIDALLVLISMEYVAFRDNGSGKLTDRFFRIFLDGLKSFTKPAAFVFFHSIQAEGRLKLERKIMDSGYPVLPTVPRALSMLTRRLQFRPGEAE
jgi:acyl-CoA synthetase (NDP forming)